MESEDLVFGVNRERFVFATKLALVIVVVLILVIVAYYRSKQTVVYMVGVEKLVNPEVKSVWNKLMNENKNNTKEHLYSVIKRPGDTLYSYEIPHLITVKDGKIIGYGRADTAENVEKFVRAYL